MKESDCGIPKRGRSFLMVLCSLILLYGPGMGPGVESAGAVEISKETIREAVVGFLESNHPWKPAEVRIREVRVPGPVVLAGQRYDLSLHVPPNTRYLGRTPVQIVFNEGRQDERRIWARAYIEVLKEVVVTRRPVGRNQVLSVEDVSLDKRDLAKVPPGALTDLGDALGLRMKRTIGAGVVLRSVLVDKPPVVKRGDVVKLLFETPRLEVIALGRVDQRGGVGDTVRVLNLDSRKRVYGRVVDSQTVRVEY
ncbi:MAG: flagellar basal body P-ring formation protein FlgA [Deltaproteobacteria bacterium]|nr:flagellar basal body P-ring formation protein FlgA [Deltaproteobacteria bacterium]